MSSFIYQAVDGQGTVFSGSVKADCKDIAAEYLLQQELFILKLDRDYWGEVRSFINSDFDERELILLCRQLTVMIKSGIPLGNAFQLISQTREKRNNKNKKDRLTDVLKKILTGLESGSSFSHVLSEAGEGIFPKTMIASIAAGEASGMLDEVLEKETASLSKRYQSKNKFKTAMIYPLFLLCTSIAVITIMLIAVLPVFSSLFYNMNASLPLPTRIILGVSDIITNYGIIFFFLSIILCIVMYWLWQNDKYQLIFYRKIMDIPVMGRLLNRLELQRWLESMSLLLASGVVLTESIRISSEVINNRYLGLKIKGIEVRVRRGETLSQISRSISCIDDFIIELMKAGEISGELPKMLSEASLLCSLEADSLLKRLEAMAEPTIILFIGITTGFLVISILMPIMEMMTLYS